MKYEKKIQYRFSEETAHGTFSDALYFDQEPSEQELNDMAQERVNNWIQLIEAPKSVPTKADFQEQLDANLKIIEDLKEENTTLQTEINK